MKLKALHIISLDVPIPADYGGVIDIYYRAKAFKQLGLKIILHCFEYGRSTNQDFSEIADDVYFYKRRKNFLDNLNTDPFIVKTRKSEELVQRLLLDNYPILMEGHHCAGLLSDQRLNDRKKFVRIHNMEWKYYNELSNSDTSFWRKLYFKSESKKLKRFETVLASADGLFSLSNPELEYYKEINPASYLWSVGCNLENKRNIETKNYALFHGNLSVVENEKSLRWIVETWEKNKLNMPLVVAGNNPNLRLKRFLNNFDFLELIENPNNEKMKHLIGKASLNLLFTFQSTGMKIKLLNALIHGKICIVNPMMVEETELGQFCEIVKNQNELAELINQLGTAEVLNPNLDSRKEYLNEHFDVLKNTKKIIDIVFQNYELTTINS